MGGTGKADHCDTPGLRPVDRTRVISLALPREQTRRGVSGRSNEADGYPFGWQLRAG
jgi:hypothetical protein